MDRNNIIGFVLIGLLLVVYFTFFAPAPPVEQKPLPAAKVIKTDSTKAVVADTARASTPLASGTLQFISVENADLKIRISNQGVLDEVELKKYKSYQGTPLWLIHQQNARFRCETTIKNSSVDLYRLFYQVETKKINDTTHIVLTASVSDTEKIMHTYTLPPSGYQIGYRMETTGMTASKPMLWQWENDVLLQEKDYSDSQKKTTINFYTENDMDELSATSDDSETIATPVKWISVLQKFFVSSVIAENSFTNTSVSLAQRAPSPIVKTSLVQFSLPANNVHAWRYYFGPNEYTQLEPVTAGFEKNLYLGWPPVLWVNKWVIMPIFNFLESFIGNYGIIITLLVLIVKLVLSPLSYKSYLGMAKMRLLKPEIDAIKEKNGDNMAQAQQDQMKLYQQAGVNPFAGCIPVLLQMPILFAMFYFFPNAIHLRQQHFLWAEDLSTYDSIIHLPFTIPFYGDHVSLFVLLMTASTLVYTWQNNQISSVTGPMKSMSYIMPIMFLFILNSFAAGLSFYYFVSNLITFAQQAIIKRFVDEDKIMSIMEENKRNAAAGKTKKSKFMTRLEEAMKANEAAKKGKKN